MNHRTPTPPKLNPPSILINSLIGLPRTFQVSFAFTPSYATFYFPSTGSGVTRIDGSLKIELGPRTVGKIEVIYDGDLDADGDVIVDTARPGGLKSPYSGVNIGGTLEPDMLPLDVSTLFGIASIVGDWDQHSKIMLPLSCIAIILQNCDGDDLLRSWS